MDGNSLTPQEIKLKQLREIMPEVFSEGKVDFERLKATLGEDITFSNERYVLNWAGKSEAFKSLQSPSSQTLIPSPGESLKADASTYPPDETFIQQKSQIINSQSENIFIEGENLEVLKILQKSYFGKIKMIYIDPPYNTGNDSFIYPDKFSETKEEYQKRVGDKDEEGFMTKSGLFHKNSKENGQYHSNWLNMMYPRLFLAKNLLRQDGVIFVSIDDNEVHNLRLLMNEIFGEENSLTKAPTALIWPQAGTTAGHFAKSHEYILCYAKSKEYLPFFFLEDYGKDEIIAHGALKKISRANPSSEIFFPKGSIAFEGEDAEFRGEIGGSEKEIINGILEFKNGKLNRDVSIKAGWAMKEQVLSWLSGEETFDTKGQKVIRFYFNNSGILWYEKERGTIHPKTLLDKDIVGTKTGSKELIDLLNGNYFENPKPLSLITYILSFVLKNNDMILDFFSGSGTTAHAVMDLNKEDGGNRKYICVQLPELTDEKSEAYKAGYRTIAEIAKVRIRRASKKISDEIKSEIEKLQSEIINLQSKLPTEELLNEIANQKSKIKNLQSQDLGFKVFMLTDSNFKQWQQIKGKDSDALAEQMKLFVDPVSENATIDNMVYELLLKSGKDLNSEVEYKNEYTRIYNNELILMLEKATQDIVDDILKEKPQKVIALDRLFTGNDQLKTNTALQMKDAGIEFKTI